MSHRVTEEWMGEQVETLEDLLRPGLHAVCIGINPAPTSVRAGHYYQGRLGQQFYERLRRAELLPRASGWEDDLAFENGIGFTDIVKRATAKASEVRPKEYAYGQDLLRARMRAVQPRLVIFTFKKTAEVLFGSIAGNGLIRDRDLAGAPIFVMPGPYAPGGEVERRLGELRELVDHPQSE
ncbi:MAG: mismatch-specific DNA-glycosylase [Gaiellaceae bacterium]